MYREHSGTPLERSPDQFVTLNRTAVQGKVIVVHGAQRDSRLTPALQQELKLRQQFLAFKFGMQREHVGIGGPTARAAQDFLSGTLSIATVGGLPKDKIASGSGFYNLTRQLGSSIISTELGLFDLTHVSGTDEFRAISKLVK